MVTTDDLDFTTRNVVQELLRECKNKSIVLSENFLIYYVQLLMLNPLWGITSGRLPNRNDVQNFVKSCTQNLENVTNPCTIALKLQLHFHENFDNLPNMIQKNRLELKFHLERLQKEILETNSDKDVVDIPVLLKKIVFLITLNSGLGNPTIDPVYKEAEVALTSILSDEDLRNFIKASYATKQAQLVEFTELVTGIRLFNRDCQKGGVGIEDLPNILIKAIVVTGNDIQNTLTTIMENVYALTTAVDNCYRTEKSEDGYVLSLKLLAGIKEVDIEKFKNILIVYRQYELFIRKILVEIHKMEITSKTIFEKFQEALLNVHKTVQFRIAIPTVQVFPLFSMLANIWRQLQDQTIALSQLNRLLINLEMQVKDVMIDTPNLKILIGPDGPITDADRLEKTNGLVIPSNANILVLNPSEIKNFDELTLEYMGFCAWKFVETHGGLIPGNSNMGVVNFGNRYYVFSSMEAAKAFSLNPKRYILRGLELARQKSELINLMQLEEQLREVCQVERLVIEVPQVTRMFNNETQTEIHPEPTKIDPNYKWNVWDWKRQALLYANLTRRVTTSTQTIKSRGLESSSTQTYGVKNTEQQTKKDNSCNVPKLSNYIYGLRGRIDDNQHVITLTRPIDESSLNSKCTDKQLKDK